jgi:hypothetical protein
METIISTRQFASIKQTAKIVAPLTEKKRKLYNKLEALNAEIASINAQINGWQQAILAMTDGYTSEALVIRSVVPYLNEDGTQKTDKDGHKLTITKYEPNPVLLEYNEEKKGYIIKRPIGEIVGEIDDTETVEMVEDKTFDPTERVYCSYGECEEEGE